MAVTQRLLRSNFPVFLCKAKKKKVVIGFYVTDYTWWKRRKKFPFVSKLHVFCVGPRGSRARIHPLLSVSLSLQEKHTSLFFFFFCLLFAFWWWIRTYTAAERQLFWKFKYAILEDKTTQSLPPLTQKLERLFTANAFWADTGSERKLSCCGSPLKCLLSSQEKSRKGNLQRNSVDELY